MVTVPQQLFSFEEYLIYDDGTDNRYELVDGKLELINHPTFKHILIAKFLENQLDGEIRRLNFPWLCFREAGIRTGWRKSRLADLYVVTIDQVTEILDQSAICQTPPLLAVEIISPESIKRDYRFKRSEYAALAIPEYWIVDPLENKVTLLIWEDGFYEESIFTGAEQIKSLAFPELKLTVELILSAGTLS